MAGSVTSTALLAQDSEATLCFKLEGYSFSGHSGEHSYLVFDLANRSNGAKTLFFKELQGLDAGGNESPGFRVQQCIKFRTPHNAAVYQMGYNHVLMFPSDFGSLDRSSDEPETDAKLQINGRVHVRKYPIYHDTIATIRVAQLDLAAQDPGVTYLRLNGQVPGLVAHVTAGLDKAPVEFSWYSKQPPPSARAEYRFRLYPVEADWSPWSADLKITYFYIAAGSYQFELESRFETGRSTWVEAQQASYQFTLTAPLIARPISKARGGIVSNQQPPTNLDSLYSRSRALLIGISAVNDKQFGPLPFESQDILHLSTALKQAGFTDVNPNIGPLRTAQVEQTLEQFARTASTNERTVVYISAHGFQDPIDRNKAYIVTNDCRIDRPASTCLSLDRIQELLQPALKKPVRHLLVLLDSCSSGLGVISKSGKFTEGAVAEKPGAHIMSAGLDSQEAAQDPALQMSTFTYYLAEGLSGKADYSQDGIVSLSELLVYVRYNVASRTSGRQTPMVGRLSGSGEIMFKPSLGKAP